MKGQYLTIEYILFFAIGISMIIIVYSMFSSTNSMLREDITRSQLERVGEIIRSNIINIYETSERTESRIAYNLTIPKKLSGCVYMVNVPSETLPGGPGTKLILRCDDTNTTVTLSLYNINTRTKNIIYSTKGLIQISKNGAVELI